ncbi:unnamed protein product [Agarophyton chilense]
MTAVSEYVTRCLAFTLQSGKQCVEDAFYEELKTNIATVVEGNMRKLDDTNFTTACTTMDDDTMSRVLEKSIVVVHTSVLNGAKLARRKHGRKKFGNRERVRVSAYMLRTMIPEFTELFATELTSTIQATAQREDFTFDIDWVRLHITKLVRVIGHLYQDVKNSGEESLIQSQRSTAQ